MRTDTDLTYVARLKSLEYFCSHFAFVLHGTKKCLFDMLESTVDLDHMFVRKSPPNTNEAVE